MAEKILVVDDEPSIIKLLKARLEDSHYEVIIANDGQEALDKTSLEKPDLIILDIMLPKIDGYRVASILKSDKDTRHIPIVMLTSRTLAQDVKAGMESGAVTYMQKPFNSVILLGIIRGLLSRKKMEEKKEVPPAAASPIKPTKGRIKSQDDIEKEIERLSREFTNKPK